MGLWTPSWNGAIPSPYPSPILPESLLTCSTHGDNMARVECNTAEEWREHYIKVLNGDDLLRYSCGYSQVIDGVADHLECAEDLEHLNTLWEQVTGFLNAIGYMFGLGSQERKMQALEDAYDEMCRINDWVITGDA